MTTTYSQLLACLLLYFYAAATDAQSLAQASCKPLPDQYDWCQSTGVHFCDEDSVRGECQSTCLVCDASTATVAMALRVGFILPDPKKDPSSLSVVEGWDIWLAVSNASTVGIRGFGGHRIRIDHRTIAVPVTQSCDEYLRAAQELIEVHKIQVAVIGHQNCMSTLSKAYTRAGIFHFVETWSAGVAQKAEEDPSPSPSYAWHMHLDYNKYPELFLRHMKKQGHKRVAILWQQNSIQQQELVRQTAVHELGILGMELAFVGNWTSSNEARIDSMPATSSNPLKPMSMQTGQFEDIDKLLQGATSRADVLMVFSQEDGINVMSRIRDQRLNFQGIFMTEAPAQQKWASRLGIGGDFVVTAIEWDARANFPCPVFGSSERYATEYRSRFGIFPDAMAARVSATGVLLQLGLQSISGNDPVKLAEWFRSSGLHQTVFGNVLFSEEQRNIGRSPLGLQQQDAKLEIVLPEAQATKTIVDVIEWQCRPFYYATISRLSSEGIPATHDACDIHQQIWLDYCLLAYPTAIDAALCGGNDNTGGNSPLPVVIWASAAAAVVGCCCVSCALLMLLLRATRNRFPPSQSNLSFGEGDIIEINKTHDGQDGDGSMSMNLKQVVMATMSHKLRSDPFWLAELKNSVLVVARPFCWSTIASNHGVYSRQCFNDAMLWASQAARKISSWRLFVSASSSNQSPPLETVSRKYSINDATNAAHHSNHRASQEHSQQYLTSAAAGLVDTLSAENRELSFWASDTANSGIVRHKPGSSDAAPACHFVAPRRVAQALSRWPCSASRNLASNTAIDESPGAPILLPGNIGAAIQLRHVGLVATFGTKVARLLSSGADKRHPPQHRVVSEVMPLGSLEDALQGGAQSLPYSTKLQILANVTAGLQHMHSGSNELQSSHLSGNDGDVAVEPRPAVIHGAVRARNILLDASLVGKLRTDISLEACNGGLLASGACRVSGSTSESVKITRGNAWAAPEILLGGQPTPEADMYALGITIWEVFAGCCWPYSFDRDLPDSKAEVALPWDLAEAIVERDLRPLFPPRFPEKLKSLVNNCWHKDPSERPSAKEVSGAIAILLLKARDQEESLMQQGADVDDIGPATIQAAKLKIFPEVSVCSCEISSAAERHQQPGLHASPAIDPRRLRRVHKELESLASKHALLPLGTGMSGSGGSAKIFIGGLLRQGSNHAVQAAAFALEARDVIVSATSGGANNTDGSNDAASQPRHLKYSPHGADISSAGGASGAGASTRQNNAPLLVSRIGLHCGPAVAVTEKNLPEFCLFGDTINAAIRIGRESDPNRVTISGNVYTCIQNHGPHEVACRSLGPLPLLGSRYGYAECFALESIRTVQLTPLMSGPLMSLKSLLPTPAGSHQDSQQEAATRLQSAMGSVGGRPVSTHQLFSGVFLDPLPSPPLGIDSNAQEEDADEESQIR